MSASGPKQTCPSYRSMSAFGGKADIAWTDLYACSWTRWRCHYSAVCCVSRSRPLFHAIDPTS
jgi:hypothetical protein